MTTKEQNEQSKKMNGHEKCEQTKIQSYERQNKSQTRNQIIYDYKGHSRIRGLCSPSPNLKQIWYLLLLWQLNCHKVKYNNLLEKSGSFTGLKILNSCWTPLLMFFSSVPATWWQAFTSILTSKTSLTFIVFYSILITCIYCICKNNFFDHNTFWILFVVPWSCVPECERNPITKTIFAWLTRAYNIMSYYKQEMFVQPFSKTIGRPKGSSCSQF